MLASLLLLSLAGASGTTTNDGLSWHWDKDTPNCSLFQQMPDGNKVYITRSPGQDGIGVSFNVRTPKFWKGYYKNGFVALSTGVTAPATIQIYSVEGRQYALHASVDDPAFSNALANSSMITIGHLDFGKFTVPVRDLGPAIAALRTCENGRLHDWGIDVDAYWALSSRPKVIGSLAELFNSDAYPGLALARDVERNVIARLEVGADGKVMSCSAPGHYAYPQFVDAVCNVLAKGARFEPARDSNGRAVSAPFVQVVSFKIGGY
jgi:TonB-like protein